MRSLGAGGGRDEESGDEENDQFACHALSTRAAPARFPGRRTRPHLGAGLPDELGQARARFALDPSAEERGPALPWPDGDHPWNVRHPVVADTRRLQAVLGVVEPDPGAATRAQIDWLWEHRAEAATVGD
jgi:hypothetical protein